MSAKPKARNWNDVQTAIATSAIVATLGMWNLFATPAKAEEPETVPTDEKVPVLPTPTQPYREPPLGYPLDVGMPKIKVMFTQVAPQTTVNVQQSQQETKKKKKKKKGNDDNGGGGAVADSGGGGGGGSVTQTQSS